MDANDNIVARSVEVIDVLPFDVLCGKGKKSFHHQGNIYFRDVISDLVEPFIIGTTATQRTNVIQDAIDRIHSRGGRFLRKHQIKGTWIEMKQDHMLEKVRNSFRDAAKKIPPKMQQRMISKNSVSPMSSKSLATTGVWMKPRQQQADTANKKYAQGTSGNESEQPFSASPTTASTLTRNRSVNSCGEFDDFKSASSLHRAKNNDDEYSVRSTPETMVSGKSPAIFRGRTEHQRSSTSRPNSSQVDIACSPYAQNPLLIDQIESTSNKGTSSNVTTKSMEVERLEDLLCAVDTALHWKASSSTSTEGSLGSISNEHLKSASLMLDVDEIVDSKPPFKIEQTKKGGSPSRKSYGNESDESNDSTFVLMMEQALGPVKDADTDNEQRKSNDNDQRKSNEE